MSARPGSSVHPCLRCGACCGAFRVTFYWGELDVGGGQVPERLTRAVSPHLVAMLGTLVEPPRCVALEGTLGDAVRCTLYEQRPSVCREFEPSYEHGDRNRRCDEARLRYGLPPLSPADWGREDVPRRPGKPRRRRRRAA